MRNKKTSLLRGSPVRPSRIPSTFIRTHTLTQCCFYNTIKLAFWAQQHVLDPCPGRVQHTHTHLPLFEAAQQPRAERRRASAGPVFGSPRCEQRCGRGPLRSHALVLSSKGIADPSTCAGWIGLVCVSVPVRSATCSRKQRNLLYVPNNVLCASSSTPLSVFLVFAQSPHPEKKNLVVLISIFLIPRLNAPLCPNTSTSF